MQTENEKRNHSKRNLISIIVVFFVFALSGIINICFVDSGIFSPKTSEVSASNIRDMTEGDIIDDIDSVSFESQKTEDDPSYISSYDPASASSRESFEDLFVSDISSSPQSLKYQNIANKNQRTVYDSYIKAAANGRNYTSDISESGIAVGFPISSMDPTEISSWTEYATLDNPIFSLYRTGETLFVYTNASSRRFAICREDFVQDSPEIVAQKYQECRDEAKKIFQEAKKVSGEDIESYIRYIYMYLSENTTYSDGIDDTRNSNDIYGSLIEKESKCYGSSCAMKYLLDLFGVDNFVATGEVKDRGGHAWNCIFYDGEWKVCDVTTGQYIVEGGYPRSDLMSTCLIEQKKYLDKNNVVISDESYQIEENFEKEISGME